MKKILYFLINLFLLSCTESNNDTKIILYNGTLYDTLGNVIINEPEVINKQFNSSSIKIWWNGYDTNYISQYRLNGNGAATIVIDSCEWIYFKIGSYEPTLNHKPNCRFCKERNK